MSKGILLKVIQLLVAEIKINSVLPQTHFFCLMSLWQGPTKTLIELRGSRQDSDSFMLALIKRGSSGDKPNDFRGQAGDLNT